jgi:hypothetical protein
VGVDLPADVQRVEKLLAAGSGRGRAR